jgi:predicted amidohydrolase
MILFRSIAVAQTRPVKGDVNANLDEHLRLTELAASEGAQIILFPELSLTGYEMGLASELAFSEHDSRLAPLIDAAESYAMTLIVGAPVRIGTRLHLAAFILGSDRTSTVYTKHRLGAFGESARRDGTVPPAEATVFQPGDRSPLVRFGGNSAAVAICADIGRESHPQQAADRGAKTYLASMFVIPSDFEGDSARLSVYARRHSMTVALANFGSPTGGLAAAGRSSIWSEKGDLLVQLNPTGAGVAVATETSNGWRSKTVLLPEAAASSSRADSSGSNGISARNA